MKCETYCPETIGKSGRRVKCSTAYMAYGCRCVACCAWKAESSAKWYGKWKAEGICTKCGQRDAAEGKTKCQHCLDRHAMRRAERYAERKAQGLCVACGEEDAIPGESVHCKACDYDHYKRDSETKRRQRRESVRERLQERGIE